MISGAVAIPALEVSSRTMTVADSGSRRIDTAAVTALSELLRDDDGGDGGA